MTPVLQAKGLVKRYGALAASDEISLSLMPGEIHGLIGPNGAGKSTLIQLLAGATFADAGSIFVDGRDMSGIGLRQRVRAGVSRSFQTANIFRQLSVFDNLLLAVQAQTGSSLRFWRPRDEDVALIEQAQALAQRCHLERRDWGTPAGLLPHGAQKLLEFALALAPHPRVLLLDEPMAGMGPDESANMTALIESLRGQLTILLVEHDMDAVFRLADRISVLVSGRIVATDTPSAIRHNATVQAAYLGDDGAKRSELSC